MFFSVGARTFGSQLAVASRLAVRTFSAEVKMAVCTCGMLTQEKRKRYTTNPSASEHLQHPSLQHHQICQGQKFWANELDVSIFLFSIHL